MFRQLSTHRNGEFCETLLEEVRCRTRSGETAGKDAIRVADDVFAARAKDHLRHAEPRAGQGFLVSIWVTMGIALARPTPRAEESIHNGSNGLVGDFWMAWAFRSRATVALMSDENHRSPRHEKVVNGVCDSFPVGPMEGLTERDQPELAEIHTREVLGTRSNPAHIIQAAPSAFSCRLGQHVGIWIDAERRLEMSCEIKDERPRTAPDIEEPPGSIKSKLVLESRG